MDNQNQDHPIKPIESDDLPRNGGSLRSVSRLFLGGLLVGVEQLNNRIHRWESSTSVEPENPPQENEDENEIVESVEPLPDELPPPQNGIPQVPAPEYQIDDLAIGLLVTAQERFARGFRRFQSIGNRISGAATPVTRPLKRISSKGPWSKTVDRLVARGEREVNQWELLGKQEKDRSKRIFTNATSSTINESIDVLTQNQELQELVQQQSTGLAEEVIEEVRERAFSLDILFDNTVRSVLRLKPRSEVPPPPIEVRQHAEGLRRHKVR